MASNNILLKFKKSTVGQQKLDRMWIVSIRWKWHNYEFFQIYLSTPFLHYNEWTSLIYYLEFFNSTLSNPRFDLFCHRFYEKIHNDTRDTKRTENFHNIFTAGTDSLHQSSAMNFCQHFKFESVKWIYV